MSHSPRIYWDAPGELAFKSFAVPIAEDGGGFVCALQKLQQGILGRAGVADIVVHQQEFAKLGVIESFPGTHGLPCKSFRLRGGIGIKCRRRDFAASGPEAGAAYLVGISFARNRVGARTFRRGPPREAGYSKIEASPEKMHRTDLTNEARPEFFEDVVDPDQNAPEPLC